MPRMHGMHAWHAWDARHTCTACMHGMHARHASTVLHGMQDMHAWHACAACTGCMACMHGVHARHALRGKGEAAGKDARYRLPPARLAPSNYSSATEDKQTCASDRGLHAKVPTPRASQSARSWPMSFWISLKSPAGEREKGQRVGEGREGRGRGMASGAGREESETISIALEQNFSARR